MSEPVTQTCPACSTPLDRVGEAAPWCPACMYALARYEPESHPDRLGVDVLDRWLYHFSYRRTMRQFTALRGRSAPRPGWSAARLLASVAGLLVYGALLACAATGVWLGSQEFPGFGLVPGIGLLGAAWWLWPREPAVPDHVHLLDRGAAPALWALVDRVAEALDAQPPDRLHLDDTFTADARGHGLLARRHLSLGIPLWACLPPQQRVAVLAHQLGHFNSGDPRRSALTGPVEWTLRRLVDALTPGRDRTLRALQDHKILYAAGPQLGVGVSRSHGLVWIAEMIWRPIAAVLRAPVEALRLGLVLLLQADGHRAEYLADARAARLAGSQAVIDALDLSLLAEPVLMLLRRDSRANAPASTWRLVAAGAMLAAANTLPLRRQLSIRRQAAPFATHPPVGLRVEMLLARPDGPPMIMLSDEESARVDEELDRHYRAVKRDLGLG